ncbi:MAG: ATP-binding cassette domain-containing protein, partial [Desulforhopalus sp.]|nr:ATP-binding cassette domain-containing protein [Desulforhopalus sp.]
MSRSPRLQVNVCKSFADFRCTVSFSIDQPRCGVFGHSGSGKSTLMAMIAGLLTPDSGRIALNGDTLFDSQAKINLPPEQRRVGIVF